MVKIRRYNPENFKDKWKQRERPDYKYIGFWSVHDDEDKYIAPQLLVDEEWEKEHKDKIIEYLKNGNICARYMGFSRCRFCGNINGSSDYTDGKWIWPTGLAHYVEEHNIRLPKEFVDYMKKNNFNIDSADEATIFGSYNFWNKWCEKEKEKWKGRLSLPRRG